MILNWGPELAIHVEPFDLQHKKLIRLLRELENSIKRSRSREQLSQIYARLRDETQQHFAAEERAMALASFAELDGHRVEHEGFLRNLGRFWTELTAGDPKLADFWLQFLKEWLRTHIGDRDKPMAAFLRARAAAVEGSI